jgi:hypothetical protein
VIGELGGAACTCKLEVHRRWKESEVKVKVIKKNDKQSLMLSGVKNEKRYVAPVESI